MNANMIELRCLIPLIDCERIRSWFQDVFAELRKWFRQRGGLFRQEPGAPAAGESCTVRITQKAICRA
jgi:hypothetical protein